MLPRRPWDALGRHGASRGGPRTKFDSILGAPEALSGLILIRFSRRVCQLAWLAEFQAKCTDSIKMHKIVRISSKFHQIGPTLDRHAHSCAKCYRFGSSFRPPRSGIPKFRSRFRRPRSGIPKFCSRVRPPRSGIPKLLEFRWKP